MRQWANKRERWDSEQMRERERERVCERGVGGWGLGSDELSSWTGNWINDEVCRCAVKKTFEIRWHFSLVLLIIITLRFSHWTLKKWLFEQHFVCIPHYSHRSPLNGHYITSRKHAYIILTPLKPHFYIVKLGFTGVYIIFLISVKNIDCGYSLEPPRRGGSNEYTQSVFWAEIWKISKFFYLKIFSFWRLNFLYIYNL